MRIGSVIILISTIFLFSSCTENFSGSKEGLLKEQKGKLSKFFSERSVSETGTVIMLLRLDLPALLTSVSLQEGRLEIDPDHKTAIEEEQARVLEEIRKIAPGFKLVYTYKLTLNGMAVLVPLRLYNQISSIQGVSHVSEDEPFGRPVLEGPTIPLVSPAHNFKNSSMKFIGAENVRKMLLKDGQPIDGKGVKVGIIDTGIDYTHKMLGGTGNPEDYKSIDASAETPHFPNSKVVGGIDLVGKGFDSAAKNMDDRIPKPDGNPLDRMGHGTHVAGTVAGLGDGINTYSGAAPMADLYAIKVFGESGFTGDMIVIAALEYALDPNGDMDINDKLDVVNLSLGGNFGKPHVMYSVAIDNFTKSGSVVVASAGNSGDVDNIVGSPSTSSQAISVAASIDYMEHNWKFSAIEVSSSSKGTQLLQLFEGSLSQKIADNPGVTGPLVAVGLGGEPLSKELAEKVKGKVALMDRGGKIPFAKKLQVAADAGAIGVLMVNNVKETPIIMSSDAEEKFEFPSAMISLEEGREIKNLLRSGEEVVVKFSSLQKIEKPQLIDTITSFSSKGPRSLDSLIKPEITAPGAQIISAAMGSGDKGTRMGGTSMSGPHVAGVMALLKQYQPELSGEQLKSMLLLSAEILNDDQGVRYPVSRQGAGRVQAFKAATLQITVDQAALSLGEVLVDRQKVVEKKIRLKNLSRRPIELKLEGDFSEGLSLMNPVDIQVGSEEEVEFSLRFQIQPPKTDESPFIELDGFVNIYQGKIKIGHMPVLAVVNQISRVSVKSLSVLATSQDDASDAIVDLVLKNQAQNSGSAVAMNLLGQDDRKYAWKEGQRHQSQTCDLQAAGYRVIEKEGASFLQIGIKLFNPVTRWQHCEVAVQIDGDLDGKSDQELVGLAASNIAGLSGNNYLSALLDAPKVRELRAKHDKEQLNGTPSELNFSSAILDARPYKAYDHSSVSVLEVNIGLLNRTPSGELALQLAVVSAEGSNVEADDFLVGHFNSWIKVQIDPHSQGFKDIPENISIPAGEDLAVSFRKGEGSSSLLVLFPQNKTVKSGTLKDKQLQVVRPSFAF